MKAKVITVNFPSWTNSLGSPFSTNASSEQITVTKSCTIHGVKHYYCRPIWSAIPGWHKDDSAD